MSAIVRERCGCWKIFRQGAPDETLMCPEHRRLTVESEMLRPGLEQVFSAKKAADSVVGKETQPDRIQRHCNELKALLLKKNQGYSKGGGFTPTRLFSKASTSERIATRLDDKLSRWVSEGPTQENVEDMLGYLILMRIEREAEGWK